MAYEYIGVTEYARLTGRHRNTVLSMIASGVMEQAGYRINRIRPKNGGKVRRIAIGVPVTQWCCADCGKEWRQDVTTPAECPSCGSSNIERRTKVA